MKVKVMMTTIIQSDNISRDWPFEEYFVLCNLTVKVRGLAPIVLCAFFATVNASLCLFAAM